MELLFVIPNLLNEFDDEPYLIDHKRQQQALMYMWWHLYDKLYNYNFIKGAVEKEEHLMQGIGRYKSVWARNGITAFRYAILCNQRFLEGEPAIKQTNNSNDIRDYQLSFGVIL